jgi:ABC-type Fe3+ transport system permease subunit
MPIAKKVFFGVLVASMLLGLLIGLANLIMPEAVSVSLNDKNVEGLTALWTSIIVSGIPGVIFGVIAMCVTAVLSRGKKN